MGSVYWQLKPTATTNMNEFKNKSSIKAWNKALAASLLMVTVAFAVQTKKANKATKMVNLLTVHATPFAVNWTKIMMETPELSAEEAKVLATIRAKTQLQSKDDQPHWADDQIQ